MMRSIKQTEASLYDKVPVNEEKVEMPVMTSDSAVLGDGGDRTTSITWTDSYFDDKVEPSDLIAVFDYDQDSLMRSLTQAVCSGPIVIFSFMIIVDTMAIVQGAPVVAIVAVTLFPVAIMVLCGGIGFCVSRRSMMSGDHPHVALTRNGIRIDTNSSNFGYETVSLYQLSCIVVYVFGSHSCLCHLSTYVLSSRCCCKIPYGSIDKIHVNKDCDAEVIIISNDHWNLVGHLVDSYGFVAMVQRQMDCYLSQQNDCTDKEEARTEICDTASAGETGRTD